MSNRVCVSSVYFACKMGDGKEVPLHSFDMPRIKELRVDFRSDAGSTGSIRLWDETSILVESYVSSAQYFLLQYSMDDGDKVWQTPKYEVTLVDYEGEYGYNGSEIEIKFVFKGQEADIFRNIMWKGKPIHEIVRELADLEGWEIGRIQVCDDVMERASFFGGEKHKTFSQSNMSSVSFIKDRLLPYAKNVDGAFAFSLSMNERGKLVLYFEPLSNIVVGGEKRVFRWDLGKSDDIVLEFKLKYNYLELIQKGAVGIEMTTLDKYSNNLIRARSGSEVDERAVHITRSSSNLSQATALMDVQNSRAGVSAFSCNITVAGGIDIKMFDVIDIIPYVKSGAIHYSAGKYKVLDISHIVGSGVVKTELGLVRIEKFLYGSTVGLVGAIAGAIKGKLSK